ncbi:MAG: cytidine deaminase [Bacteroidales bacterium]|jgi:cytidine deaminase|nr:cytidine deaminase [Bacteroidales bacterium]
MEKRNIAIHYFVFRSIDELADADRSLLEKAEEASRNAYTPYSGFSVGAAVLLDNEEIITANNQENASYPQGLCAERTALFYAMAQHPNRKVKAIAVYGYHRKHKLKGCVSPCGGCRQVMLECEQRGKEKMRILLSGYSGEITVIEGVEQLLPLQFSGDFLCDIQ